MNRFAVLQPSATATEGTAFPMWLAIGVPLLIAGLAIAYAAATSSRLQTWHEDAASLCERGAELGEAVRTWASHPGAAGDATWADLRKRDVHLAAQARRLGTRAPGEVERERALNVARAATVLGDRLERPQREADPGADERLGAEILAAASSLQTALFALRSAA
jgi:hypothetical protein